MRTLQFRGTQIHFVDACPVCLTATHREHEFQRTFTYGRRSIHLSLRVPLCSRHNKDVSVKTRAQRWSERLSPVAGTLVGLAVGTGLLRYWSVTNQGSALFNVLIALSVAISFAVTVWAILLFWIAPSFASPAAKAVLRSLRMTRYDPSRNILELTFTNDTVAELTARANLAILIAGQENLRAFRIYGHILDHDIRYNNSIQTQVLLDHAPTQEEALALLQPVVEKVMVQQLGEGTFYDLSILAVEEFSLT